MPHQLGIISDQAAERANCEWSKNMRLRTLGELQENTRLLWGYHNYGVLNAIGYDMREIYNGGAVSLDELYALPALKLNHDGVARFVEDIRRERNNGRPEHENPR